MVFITRIWGALTLDGKTLQELKLGGDNFWFALQVFFLIGLIVNLPVLAAVSHFSGQTPIVDWTSQAANWLQALGDRLPGILGDPFLDAAAVFEGVANSLREAGPPLGRLTSQYVRLFGSWVGLVLEWLAAWIAAGLGLWLFACWMGGRGSLRQHMSLFLLAVIPQIFTLGSKFSGDNPAQASILSTITLIGWIWSLVMIIKNLVIAHELPLERAMLALLLFLSFSLIIVPMMLLLLLGALIGTLV